MNYGRLPNDILTIIDGDTQRKLNNTESIDRVYYDYHGVPTEDDFEIYEMEMEVAAR